MIEAGEFVELARVEGFDFWAGVPCSYLKPFINYVIDDPGLTYLSSANEGDAVAAATGAALGGRRGVAIMQNSGLGNAVSPLTSLNWVFRIPVLLIVTLRGDPELGDEPQHELMGRVTANLLETIEVPWRWFPDRTEDVEPALREAVAAMDASGRPYAFIMRKGSVAPHALQSAPPSRRTEPGTAQPPDTGVPPARRDVLAAIIDATPVGESVVIATTGYTGRELYALDDRPNQLYMVGSIGCAASLGLGLSLARPDLRVVVADGDGAALMRLGNLAAIGAYGSPGLAHVVLDNGMHESTGGQATLSHVVDFAAAAAACGYAEARQAGGAADVGRFLRAVRGPALCHVRIAPGVPDDLPRPTVSPPRVRARLMEHMGVTVAWTGLI